LRLHARVLAILAVVTICAAALTAAAYAGVPRLDHGYLYRYFVWGGRHHRDLSKDYEMFPSLTTC